MQQPDRIVVQEAIGPAAVVDCTAKVSVYFERGTERSTAYGPYTRFSMVDGLAYGDNHVIAFMDYKTKEWLYYDTGYRWPVMVVNGS